MTAAQRSVTVTDWVREAAATAGASPSGKPTTMSLPWSCRSPVGRTAMTGACSANTELLPDRVAVVTMSTRRPGWRRSATSGSANRMGTAACRGSPVVNAVCAGPASRTSVRGSPLRDAVPSTRPVASSTSDSTPPGASSAGMVRRATSSGSRTWPGARSRAATSTGTPSLAGPGLGCSAMTAASVASNIAPTRRRRTVRA